MPASVAAQLIYNAIFAPTVVWRDDAYTNKTLIGDEDLPTVGEKFMGLKNPKGILTSVKYDDNDKTYTTVIDRVGADDLSFDATADYSALMGQQVKALYKEGKNATTTPCTVSMLPTRTRPLPLWLTTSTRTTAASR